jgi:hypothetical protein
MIMNKEIHKNIKFTSNPSRINKQIRNRKFISLEEIDDDFYEITMEKDQTLLDTPVVLGFSVLQYAKLRMLEFYYDCIDRYVDRRDYQLCEMDTDSNYMALSAPLFDIIHPHLRHEFFNNYGKWFPRLVCDYHHNEFISTMLEKKTWKMDQCCLKINKYDQRTPGLFKEEFKGIGIISLNSKTYFCWTEDPEHNKYRSKGLSRHQNHLTQNQFMTVLKNKDNYNQWRKSRIFQEKRGRSHLPSRKKLTNLPIRKTKGFRRWG